MPRPKHHRRAHWAAYLWPGLAHLWIKGSFAGLVLALSFSVLLNVLVLSSLVWPAWLETRLRLVCALGLGVLWLAALWETRSELRRLAEKRAIEEAQSSESAESAALLDEIEPPAEEVHPNDQRLAEAQKCYLCGDWVQAEQILRRACRADRRDVEARLWYAMLLRRTGRWKQARRRIDRLELFEAASHWKFEITEERRLIERLELPSPVVNLADKSGVADTSTSDSTGSTSEERITELEQQETDISLSLLTTEELDSSSRLVSEADRETDSTENRATISSQENRFNRAA